jgi:hypothetical protein
LELLSKCPAAPDSPVARPAVVAAPPRVAAQPVSSRRLARSAPDAVMHPRLILIGALSCLTRVFLPLEYGPGGRPCPVLADCSAFVSGALPGRITAETLARGTHHTSTDGVLRSVAGLRRRPCRCVSTCRLRSSSLRRSGILHIGELVQHRNLVPDRYRRCPSDAPKWFCTWCM